MRLEPKPYEVFTHFKGKQYQVLLLAVHAQTEEKYVVYQAMYDDHRIYVREYDEFMSEVDRERYPDVKQKYRFAREDELSETVDKTEAEELGIDPLVLEFLDADTIGAKLNILAALHHRITDDMINTMAVAIDVEVNDGPIEERYEALKTCLVTRERYECSRM